MSKIRLPEVEQNNLLDDPNTLTIFWMPFTDMCTMLKTKSCTVSRGWECQLRRWWGRPRRRKWCWFRCGSDRPQFRQIFLKSSVTMKTEVSLAICVTRTMLRNYLNKISKRMNGGIRKETAWSGLQEDQQILIELIDGQLRICRHQVGPHGMQKRTLV